MAISTKINSSSFANEASIRIDFNYVNYLNNTNTNSKLSRFINSKKPQETNPPEEFNYVEIGDLNSKGEIIPSKVNLNIRDFDNEDLIKKIENGNIQSVEKDDILISSVRPNLQKIVIIDDKLKNYFFTTAFHKINSKINPKICFYLLKFVYSNTLNSIARMGKGYPTLKIDDILSAKIDEKNFNNFIKNENEILKKLNEIELKIKKHSENLIDETEIINHFFEKTYNYDFKKILKNYYKKNYKTEFSNLGNSSDLRLGFKFRNPLRSELISLSNHFSKYKIKDYLDIPIKLGQTLTENNIDSTSDKHYISMADIKTLYLNIENTSKISEDFYDQFKDVNSTISGDILLARSGEGTIGKVAVVDQEIEGLFADFVMRIRLKDYPPNYAYYFFRSNIFQELVNLTKKGLGNNTNIYPSDISELPLPNLDSKFTRCCEEISKKIQINKKKLKEIDKLKIELNKYINKYMK